MQLQTRVPSPGIQGNDEEEHGETLSEETALLKSTKVSGW